MYEYIQGALKRKKKQSTTMVLNYIRKSSTSIKLSPNLPVKIEAGSPQLLGRCSSQLRKSCASKNMVYSTAERVFTLEQYFASKPFAVWE
jgi:hypothetical protein